MSDHIALLPMYDWPEVRAETDALWATIHTALQKRGIASPDALDREAATETTWLSPRLLLSQTCGLPLVQDLRDQVAVLGRFTYQKLPVDGDYHSVIITRRTGSINNPSDLKFLESEFSGEHTLISRNYNTSCKTGSKSESYFRNISNYAYAINYDVVIDMTLNWFRDDHGNDLSFNKGISIGNIIARRLLSAFANDFRNYYTMKYLFENKNIDTRGLEISKHNVQKCISKGLSVIEGNAEKDLQQFPNASFDYVILSQTLQAFYKPEKVIDDLLRVANKAIVTIPNFGYWKVRLNLLFKGTMPVTKNLPNEWYDTPNLHMLSLIHI